MTPREVTDQQGTTWACVQAYTEGLTDKTEKLVDKLAERTDGTVRVICTPTGGEQSVRLKLQQDWMEQLSESVLLSAISAARKED